MNANTRLDRFVEVQKLNYETALREIRMGKKTSHWMWYIFPQLIGLGKSATAEKYAIQSKEEAVAYLNHPVLRKNLVQISEALLNIRGKSIREILGTPDDLKLKSSMTLFATIQTDEPVFQQILEKYYAGNTCPKTGQILGVI